MYRLLIDNNEFNGVTIRDASFARRYEGESIRLRDFMDGSVVLWGEAYRYVKGIFDAETQVYADIQLLWSDDLMFTGRLMLNGQWMEAQNSAVFSCETNDEYTILLKSIDTEIDIPAPVDEGRAYEKESFVCNNVLTNMRYKCLGEATVSNLLPPGWLECGGSISAHDLPLWDENTQYKSATEFTDEGQRGYLGDVLLTPDKYGYAGNFVRDSNFRTYAAKTDTIGDEPNLQDQSVWEWLPALRRMGQAAADLQFDGGIFFDNKWGAASCVNTTETLTIQGYRLFEVMQFAVGQVDSSIIVDYTRFLTCDGITAPNPSVKNLIVYFPDDTFQTSLAEIFGIYMMVFNTDWRLKDQYLEFRNPSELYLDPALGYEQQPYQYLNRIFSKDWSSEQFNSDASKRIHKETFQIGNIEPDPIEDGTVNQPNLFHPVEILYRNDYPDMGEVANNSFEVNMPTYLKDPQSILVFAADESNVIQDIYALDMGHLMQFYRYDRPFKYGELVVNNLPPSYSLFEKAKYNKSDIEVPYNKQFLDFDFEIETKFGNLDPTEISINLGSASATITAVK